MLFRFGLLVASVFSSLAIDPCSSIDRALLRNKDPNETTACKCLIDPVPFDQNDNVWIGCTGHSMSMVFKALGGLNETRVNRVHVWDSILNILPAEMFEKVRPRILIVENSLTSVVRPGTFTQIGTRLVELRLRNNAFKKRIENSMLNGLDRLQILDMSGNKLVSIKAGDLEGMSELRELILNDNLISQIDDRAFSSLSSLRILSIQGNHLTAITKDTFKGLDNLEYLYLQNNKLESIDWSAFQHLKRLKHIDLGRNFLTNVDLRALEALEKLIINNNSIQSLKSVTLKDLPSLVFLSLDRNAISEIDDLDLFGLAPSTRLDSLSMASNNISVISARAFQHVSSLRTLALQNNQILSLSTGSTPILRSLRRLAVLLISGNQLSALRESELPITLQILSADHNQISHIDAATFNSMRLQKLLLNDNLLAFLPKGTFDPLDLDILQAIDLSANKWQCVCTEEWLGSWLDKVGERDVADGPLGCLVTRCEDDKLEEQDHSTWVTIAASILAAVSILILISIAFLCFEDARAKMFVSKSFRRVDSDLLKLINDNEAKSDATRGVYMKPKSENSQKSVRFIGN
ncbi:unnamed protein product, partial [Mesorhabditis belari]|uniref:Uncharacterized protein n=1 Tax=Mesorhabditis belari TaxID=2138241 RepID=A0AAF3EB09_9BILA